MEADVRRSVRALGGGAERTFFAELWAARREQALGEDGSGGGPAGDAAAAAARRTSETLRAFELDYTRRGRERAADALDACVCFLQTSYEGEALPEVLALLTSLARTRAEGEGDENAEPLTGVADRLLAAADAGERRNQLARAAGLARRRGPDESAVMLAAERPASKRTAAGPAATDALVRSACVTPSAERLMGTSVEGPATTLRLRLQTRSQSAVVKGKRPRPAGTAGDKENWASAAQAGDELFARLATGDSFLHRPSEIDFITQDPTGNISVADRAGDQTVESRPAGCLLGALVSGTCSNIPELDMMLSMPELDAEYDGFAPDPLGFKIASASAMLENPPDDEPEAKVSCSATDDSSGSEKYAATFTDVEWPLPEDPWLSLARKQQVRTQRILLGWEEEVPASFRAPAPYEERAKSIQYSAHAVLSSERGTHWFEHLIEHSARFERSRTTRMVAPQTLRRDILYALLGVPSSSFHLEAEPMRLVPCQVRMRAVSAESLSSLLAQVAACGTMYLSLTSLCQYDSLLSGMELADVVAERVDAHILAHQRRVGALLQTMAHEEFSLLELSFRIETTLVPPLRRLGALFSWPAGPRRTTLRMLEHFHISTVANGPSLRSIERDMLWCCLERVIDVISGWAFSGSDALEHFEGCFLTHNSLGDTDAGHTEAGSLPHGALLAAIAENKLPYSVNLPMFCKSSLRGVAGAAIARRAALCGALLRLLRGMPACAPLFSLCTNPADKVAFARNAFRAGRNLDATALQGVQFESSARRKRLFAEVIAECDRAEQARRAAAERRRKEAWKVIEDARAAAEAVNARFQARSREEQLRIEAERKSQLEGFRAAAEDARAAKVRARLEKQAQERSEQPRDMTSPISDEQRAEAERYLLEQFQRLEQEQVEQGGALDASLAAAKRDLEAKLTSLRNAGHAADEDSLITSVVIHQPPGGVSTAASILYDGQPSPSSATRTSVRMVQRQEDDAGRAALTNAPIENAPAHTSVRMVQREEENAARAALTDAPVEHGVARTSVRMVQHEEDDAARAAITDAPAQTSPARTSVRIVDRSEDDAARAAITDAPVEHGVARTSVRMVQHEEDDAARAAITDAPAQTSPARTSVRIVDRSEDDAARAAITHAPVEHGVARTSVRMVQHEEDDAARAAITDAPTQTSPARTSVRIVNRNEDDAARAAIKDAPTQTSPARTSVRIVDRNEDDAARAAITDDLPVDASPAGPRHGRSPGGLHPGAARSSVHVSQPAGGTSTIGALFARTGRTRELLDEHREGAGHREEAVRRIRDAMVQAVPLRYGDAISTDLEECRQPPGGAASQAIDESLEDLGCDDTPCGALGAAIELALVEPLLQQCDLVEATFVAVLVRQSSLLEALEGVRSTVLMAQGDLFNGLVSRIYDMRLRGADLRHRKGGVLQEAFATEADSLGLSDQDFAQHFCYSVDTTKEEAQGGHEHFSKFSFVQAEYELQWPLSFIVREQDKAAYPLIHRFLLRLKYAGALVRRVWKRLCETRSLDRLPILTWLSIRWHQVRNLMSSLEDYVMGQLLTEHWAAMEAAFRAPCASFRHPHELQEVHHRFAQAALRTCFLDGSNVSNALRDCIGRTMERTDSLARLSLQVLDQVLDPAASRAERANVQVPRDLEAAWKDFSKTQTFLLRTVNSYSRNAILPDGAARRILVHLNYNHFYA